MSSVKLAMDRAVQLSLCHKVFSPPLYTCRRAAIWRKLGFSLSEWLAWLAGRGAGEGEREHPSLPYSPPSPAWGAYSLLKQVTREGRVEALASPHGTPAPYSRSKLRLSRVSGAGCSRGRRGRLPPSKHIISRSAARGWGPGTGHESA